VIRNGSLLPDVADLRGPKNGWPRYTRWQIQDGEGVSAGIRSGVQSLKDDEMCVVAFCDNVYPHTDRDILNKYLKLPSSVWPRYMTVRKPHNFLTSELDYWNELSQQWHTRSGGYHHPSSWAMAGFVIAAAGILKQAAGTLVSTLNTLNFKPIFMPQEAGNGESWFDLGTTDSYRHYLKESMREV